MYNRISVIRTQGITEIVRIIEMFELGEVDYKGEDSHRGMKFGSNYGGSNYRDFTMYIYIYIY